MVLSVCYLRGEKTEKLVLDVYAPHGGEGGYEQSLCNMIEYSYHGKIMNVKRFLRFFFKFQEGILSGLYAVSAPALL